MSLALHYPHKQVVVSHERKNGPENFFDSTTRFLKHMNILLPRDAGDMGWVVEFKKGVPLRATNVRNFNRIVSRRHVLSLSFESHGLSGIQFFVPLWRSHLQ
jgi:hypothetical protein